MRMGIAEIVDLIRTGFIPSDNLDEGEVLIAAVNEVRDGLQARVRELEQALRIANDTLTQVLDARVSPPATTRQQIDLLGWNL
jgi:hypothetical protein